MTSSRFERSLPWSGVVAALCWVGHDAFERMGDSDSPGAVSVAVIRQNLAVNYASVACLVVMGIALLFFASSVRGLLRSGEALEATYSSIAFGGWVVVAAALGQMVAWDWALLNGAAADSDQSAAHTLGYVQYFGWAGMGVGLAAAFIATGLGGLRHAVLPRWFAVVTVVCGVLGALGNAGIPPGGLVTYVLLPFWLIAAAIIVARRQRQAERSSPDVPAQAVSA